jgi:hypothetical protein
VAQGYNDLRMTVRVDDKPMGSRLRRPEGQQLPLRAALTRAGADFSGRMELVTNGNRVVASGTGASWTATLTVGDQERYYFLRILDPDTGRPVAFSSPVWVMPGPSPLPLCEADGGGAASIL